MPGIYFRTWLESLEYVLAAVSKEIVLGKIRSQPFGNKIAFQGRHQGKSRPRTACDSFGDMVQVVLSVQLGIVLVLFLDRGPDGYFFLDFLHFIPIREDTFLPEK
jgi:hypothetical protein